MNIQQRIQEAVIKELNQLFSASFSEKDFQINQTKPEFEGDYTIVLFSLVKSLKQSPEALGNALGEALIKNNPALFLSHNIIKGFLNLTIADSFWLDLLNNQFNDVCFGKQAMNGQKVMVEYASPNTNKPLHLGHLRNIFLGWSVAEILKATGYEVIKTSIVNDRGIHICKSMIAWQLYANNATPETTGIKGDHLVGDYYVKFNDVYKEQVEAGMANGLSKEDAEKQAPIMQQTQQMLLDWEAGKPEVIELWKKMNAWVYAGFDQTFQSIGCDFNKTYYESDTYLLGKDLVQEGLNSQVFFRKEDGSIWIDLTDEGLDQKLLLRKDGTSVYITQDIGLAKRKHDDFGMDQSIYVIGDEQNYHMQVLQKIAQKLQFPYAKHIFHLSYGMVELPSGKMKSREGTVVDADDIVTEMKTTAQTHTESLGKVDGFNEAERTELYRVLGLGAMKFYLLRVDPKKKMIFNPEESIDFHGFTGPFIQYTYARIQSIFRKEQQRPLKQDHASLLPLEKQLILVLEQFAVQLKTAAHELNPSVLANYLFSVAKTYNAFYAEHSISQAETPEKKNLRLQLSSLTSIVLKSGMQLLGIDVPERM
jgi:arginyl-tRNA synthetase